MSHIWTLDSFPEIISSFWDKNTKNLEFKFCKNCKLQMVTTKSITERCEQYVICNYSYFYINNLPCKNNCNWEILSCEEILIKNLLE